MTVALLSIDTQNGVLAVYVRNHMGKAHCNIREQIEPEGWALIKTGAEALDPALLDIFRRQNSQPAPDPRNRGPIPPTGPGTPVAQQAVA